MTLRIRTNFGKSFSTFFPPIQQDIFAFAKALHFSPTDQQADLLTAVQAATYDQGHRRIACRSGQGPGKTTASAVVGLWRAIRARGALTVVTSPTMRQCKEIWLAEARRLLQNADPHLRKIVEVTKSKIVICKQPKWGCELVTATRAENAQGLHQANLTVICEEASGIERPIIEQFEGTITNPDVIMLMIGNPNTSKCAFYDCFTLFRHLWKCLHWNAEESPLVSEENIRYLAEKYGVDSDVYRVRVLGEFPHSDPNCVIGLMDAEAATVTDQEETKKNLRWGVSDDRIQYAKIKQFGIDFARFGSDESVIYQREGDAIVKWHFYSHVDPNIIVDKAFVMQHDAQWKDPDTWFVADAGGMGQGCMYNFYQANKLLHEFHNAGTPANSSEYANRITEAWFNVRDKLKRREITIPKDSILIQQLTTREYTTDKNGKLILETKDQYMKRDLPSPDRADALVMAYYDAMIIRGGVHRKIESKKYVGGGMRR